MNYLIGQSYDMKVFQIVVEKFPTSLFYVLAENGQKLRVYDFEKKRCSNVVSIKCIYKGLNESGEPVFHRDRLYLLKELYTPGVVYEFEYKSVHKEGDTILYYNVRDIFGMQQIYRGPLSDEQRKSGTKIKLLLKGINEPEVSLLLEPVPSIINSSTSVSNDNLEYLFKDYIDNGSDTVLKAISRQVSGDLKIKMWGSLYRMAQNLDASTPTLKDIRKEIVAAYKRYILKGNDVNAETSNSAISVFEPTKTAKQIGAKFDEGKSITQLMGVFGLTRQEVVNTLIKMDKFYKR